MADAHGFFGILKHQRREQHGPVSALAGQVAQLGGALAQHGHEPFALAAARLERTGERLDLHHLEGGYGGHAGSHAEAERGVVDPVAPARP